MSKTPFHQEPNASKEEAAFQKLKSKVEAVEKALDEQLSNRLGPLAQCKSVTGILKFSEFGLEDISTSRSTLLREGVKSEPLKKRYEALRDRVKAIRDDKLYDTELKESVERAEQLQETLSLAEDKNKKLTAELVLIEAKKDSIEDQSRQIHRRNERLEKRNSEMVKLVREQAEKLRKDKGLSVV